MGADTSENVQESINAEQNAVGLISALLLTINAACARSGIRSPNILRVHKLHPNTHLADALPPTLHVQI